MKKNILVLALCLIGSSVSFAQKFHFGLGITPSLVYLHPGSDDLKGDGSKFGFNYGLITEFAITDNYSFATGLTIDSKGGKVVSKVVTVDTAGNPTTFSGDFTLKYIDVPLTMKMKTNQIGYMKYYGQFGLAPGFLIGARGTTKYGSTLIADDADVKDDINNFNLSLVIGLGIEYTLSGNTNLLVGVIYKNGFSDVLNADSKANVNSIGLNIGVLF